MEGILRSTRITIVGLTCSFMLAATTAASVLEGSGVNSSNDDVDSANDVLGFPESFSFLPGLLEPVNSTNNTDAFSQLINYITNNIKNSSIDVEAVKNKTQNKENCSSTHPSINNITTLEFKDILCHVLNVSININNALKGTTIDPFALELIDVLSRTNVTLEPTYSPNPNRYLENITNINEVSDYIQNASSLDLQSVNILASKVQSLVRTENTDAREVVHVMSKLASVTSTDSNTVQLFGEIFSSVINQSNYGTGDIMTEVLPEMMLSMENVLAILDQTEEFTLSTEELEISSSMVGNTENGTEDRVVIQTLVGTVTMPVLLFDGKEVRVSTIVYKSVQQTLTVVKHKNAKIGSNVLSVSLQQVQNKTITNMDIQTGADLILVLPTDIKGREKGRLCTYWNFEKSCWDTYGSTLLEKNSTHTTCQYNHLTNYAVLVLYYNNHQVPEKQKRLLHVLTTIGCSLSIVCLGVTVIVFFYLRILKKETIMIHANLSISLLLAQLILVTSQEAVEHTLACKIVAVSLHFFFMASFTWMLVEGVALYLVCTRGICAYGDMRVKYFLLGYGVPAIIVVVSVGFQFPQYGETTDKSCWLSIKDGLIWAFMGPMIIIMIFNMFVLCLVIKVFLTLRANSRKSEAERLRASVRAIVTLMPLLGVTWILSLLVPLHTVFHYLFVIANSMQGMMIFLLHCVGNEDVRKNFQAKTRWYPSNHSVSDSSEMYFRKRLDEIRTAQLSSLATTPRGSR